MESSGSAGVGARDAANTSLTSNTWCPMTGHTLHGSYLCMPIFPHSSHLVRIVMVSCHNFKCIHRCIKIAHSTKGKKNTVVIPTKATRWCYSFRLIFGSSWEFNWTSPHDLVFTGRSTLGRSAVSRTAHGPDLSTPWAGSGTRALNLTPLC